jgi:hypothetical protein
LKLWIIYKDGIGFARIVAEILQDRLEHIVDTSVGNAKKVDPKYVIEESLDGLILGDIIIAEIPSFEIQNWLLKYCEISKKKNLILKIVSGFYVSINKISNINLWDDFLQKNIKSEEIFLPILSLKLNQSDLSLEHSSAELLKQYTNDFIEFIVNNKKIK